MTIEENVLQTIHLVTDSLHPQPLLPAYHRSFLYLETRSFSSSFRSTRAPNHCNRPSRCSASGPFRWHSDCFTRCFPYSVLFGMHQPLNHSMHVRSLSITEQRRGLGPGVPFQTVNLDRALTPAFKYVPKLSSDVFCYESVCHVPKAEAAATRAACLYKPQISGFYCLLFFLVVQWGPLIC